MNFLFWDLWQYWWKLVENHQVKLKRLKTSLSNLKSDKIVVISDGDVFDVQCRIDDKNKLFKIHVRRAAGRGYL